MNRNWVVATCGCSILLNFCVSAFAGSIPGIRGQVLEKSSQQPVSGVLVELYVDDGSKTFDEADAASAVAMTDASGNYAFHGLDGAKSYFVMQSGEVSAIQTLRDTTFVIDTFDITQSVVADPIGGGKMSTIAGPGSVLGGHRDMYLEIRGGVADGMLRVNPFLLNSNLQIDMAAGVTGMASVTWDGVSGLTGMEPDHGLAMDFTGDGAYEGVAVRLAVDAAGDGQMLELLIHSGDGRVSRASVPFPVVPDVEPTVVEYVPFSDFDGNADLTQVSAFQMVINAEVPSLDAQIDVIGLSGPNTVDFELLPEPSSALLALICWVSLLVLRRQNPAQHRL